MKYSTDCAILYNVILDAARGGIPLTYSYNRLWKLLIDRGLTKTELKSIAGVSTNIIAKMGKNEPISMESLAKITTALQCGLDDIVEIVSEVKNNAKD